MRVREAKRKLTFDHELVPATGVWTFKTNLSELADQVGPADWAKPRHQATGLIASSIPSTAGTRRFLDIRKRTLFQHLSQLLPTGFQVLRVRIDAVKALNLIVIQAIFRQDLIPGAA